MGRAEEKQNGVVVSRLSPISQATGSAAHKIHILKIEGAFNKMNCPSKGLFVHNQMYEFTHALVIDQEMIFWVLFSSHCSRFFCQGVKVKLVAK